MEGSQSHKSVNALHRHLAVLKVVSRLLGHELHSQSGGKSITLSREEAVEIQMTLDLFIEEASRRMVGGVVASGLAPGGETQLVPARN